MKILLLQLEFSRWKTARPWSYPTNFGIAQVLRDKGIDTFTIPIVPDQNVKFQQSWLGRARELCSGMNFDQVWVWLLHYPYEQDTLDWIRTIAPIRIGILVESLQYDEEDYVREPHLKKRSSIVQQQVECLTHVLAGDENDVASIHSWGYAQALWWPCGVPEQSIRSFEPVVKHQQAVFHGTVYGNRERYFSQHELRQVLTCDHTDADQNEFHQLFDEIQIGMEKMLCSGSTLSTQDLHRFVGMLHQVRYGEFMKWMEYLQSWAVVVNLPSYAKFYGGRIFEGLAAGRPVISWEIPHHPKNNSLFQDGEEMLLFPKDNPNILVNHIERLLSDSHLAKRLVCSAQRKLRELHTVEKRVNDVLQWVETGAQACYEGGQDEVLSLVSQESESGKNPMLHSSVEERKCSIGGMKIPVVSTTVFVITIGDCTFPQCKEALLNQDLQTFKLDVIEKYHPMSAAFQEMIRRCETEYFIQVDEDMILEPTAVSTMESWMQKAPDDVGMMCFHLQDIDRNRTIQGVKIYRTNAMKALKFRDVKACEMDLLEQMAQKGIRWILHPTIQGRHGTHYTPETIYRRYKTMYEKDIREWNDVTEDIRSKAVQFRETGDSLALFALMGAVDGIISAPYANDQEKDFTKYEMKSLNVFRQIFLENHMFPLRYNNGREIKRKYVNPPILLEHVQWKSVEKTGSSEYHDPMSNESEISTMPRSAALLKKKRILLTCNYFWPSMGGVETVVGNLGHELVAQGYQVDVATVALPNRSSSEYHGMRIISLDNSRTIDSGPIPYLCLEFYRLLTSGTYDSCVLFSNPQNWLMTSLLFGDISPMTKLYIQLLVNREGFEEWRYEQEFCERLGNILRKAHGALALTRRGIEAEFMRDVGVSPLYLPNGTTPLIPNMDFRETYGVSKDTFLIVHVANIWKVKNHLGLLQTLSNIPQDWRLVLIGTPNDKGGSKEMKYAQQVNETLQRRPDVLYISGLPREGVAAAVKAANVVVLSSHAEISPMAILESMSYGTPWLATPECGDVADKAGGIVAPLEAFPLILKLLREHPDLCQSLSKLGFAHWQACFSGDVVNQGWLEILEKGSLSKSYEMPMEITDEMDSLQKDLNVLLARHSLQPRDQHPKEMLDNANLEQASLPFPPLSKAIGT